MEKENLENGQTSEFAALGSGSASTSEATVINNKELTRDIEKRWNVESDKIVDVDPDEEKKDQGNRFMIILVSVTLSVVTLASLIYSLVRVFG